MFRLIIACMLSIIFSFSAFAQEKREIGVTGTILMAQPFYVDHSLELTNITPWSIGVALDSGGSDYKILVERFSEREFSFIENGSEFYSQVDRSSFIAIRAEKSWVLHVPSTWVVQPTAAIFGGVGIETKHQSADPRYGPYFCLEGAYCAPNKRTMLVHPKTGSRPYVGVTIGVSRDIGKDTQVGVMYDAYSTMNRKLRVVATWWPGKK